MCNRESEYYAQIDHEQSNKYKIQDTRPGQLPVGIAWGAYLLFCNPKPLRTEVKGAELAAGG